MMRPIAVVLALPLTGCASTWQGNYEWGWGTTDRQREEAVLYEREHPVGAEQCDTKTIVVRRAPRRATVSSQTTLQTPGCGRTGVVVIDR